MGDDSLVGRFARDSQAGDAAAPRRPLVPCNLLAVAAIALVLIALTAVTWPYLEDDAYIHCQFARSVVERGEFSFNPGEIVFGDTAPLWVAALAVPGAVGIPYDATSKVLSAFFGLVAAWLFARLFQRLSEQNEAPDHRLGWLMAFFLLHPFMIAVIASGMETTLALSFLLATFLLARVDRFGTTGAPAWPAAAFGLFVAVGALVRPEFVLLAPCIAGAALFSFWRHRRALRSSRFAPRLAVFLLSWGICLVAIGLLLQGYFGTVIPTTMQAKAYAREHFSMAALTQTVRVFAFGFGPLGVLVIGQALLGGRERVFDSLRRIPAVIHLWVLGLFLGYFAISTNLQTRYALFFWPWVAILAARFPGRAGARLHVRVARHLPLAVLVIQAALTAAPAIASRVANARACRGYMKCLAGATLPGEPVGSYSIGEVAYRAHRRVFDGSFIVSPELAGLGPEETLRLAVTRGVRYVTTIDTSYARLGISPSEAVCTYFHRNATWGFPPSWYWKGWNEALVPIQAIRFPRGDGESSPAPSPR